MKTLSKSVYNCGVSPEGGPELRVRQSISRSRVFLRYKMGDLPPRESKVIPEFQTVKLSEKIPKSHAGGLPLRRGVEEIFNIFKRF